MGSLNLPPGSLVYLDANAVIYSVEKVPDFWPILQTLWSALSAGTIRVASSELTMLECLVGPLKSGDVSLINTYEELFSSGDLELFRITRNELRRAAEIRAANGLKTPDAIHAASALAIGCTHCISNDVGLRKVPALPLIILSDLLTSP